MNSNKQIGWIICESSDEPIGKPKIVNSNGRRVIAEVVLQRANSKNRNGRFYDSKDLFPQLTCARSKELLRTKWAMEAGHPMSKDLLRQQTIDPSNEMAYLLKLWTEGDLVVGNVRGSNNPILGESFNQDLLDGFKPAFSLRALGSIENTSRGAEVKGIKIICYDVVTYPSHPEAYVRGVVSESATNFESRIEAIIREKNDKIMIESGLLAPIVNQQVIDYIKQESCNFKTICNEFEVFYDDIQLVNEGTQVQLSNKSSGDVIIVNLENYIHNEIMDYCYKR